MIKFLVLLLLINITLRISFSDNKIVAILGFIATIIIGAIIAEIYSILSIIVGFIGLVYVIEWICYMI